MTVIELNNNIINIQYKRLKFANEGISIKDTIDFEIILNMCYNVLNNKNMFQNDTLNKINNIIDVVYDKCN